MRKHQIITLTSGDEVLIDCEDYIKVCNYNWYLINGEKWLYAANKKLGLMHQFIFGYVPGKMIHHKNDNGLDNRKENLEHVTNQQNQARSRKTVSSTHSKYKGVSFREDTRKWVAYIRVDYKMINLGSFLDEEEAARTYDKAAIDAWGDYARTNF